ncbi:MAG: hypothetical protein KA347_12150 [Bacteroidia bacterium]|jgi:hypothetical protein|nr:hypothetical protein [Bacteroidota bacterium]MBP6513411.1 hypothetical protein [Bacteroidia bacterium]MBP7245884.1 hypothetical protein [Bacteroidia bacterium]
MKSPSAAELLSIEIAALEKKQEAELLELKQSLRDKYESLKPINIIKRTFSQLTSSDDVKNSIVSEIAGITAGALSSKLLFGKSKNPLKVIGGLLFQFLVATYVSKKEISIDKITEKLSNFFSGKMNQEEEEEEEKKEV